MNRMTIFCNNGMGDKNVYLSIFPLLSIPLRSGMTISRLIGCCPSELPPSAQHCLMVWLTFLHFELVQQGRIFPFLVFRIDFELKGLRGLLPDLAINAAA